MRGAVCSRDGCAIRRLGELLKGEEITPAQIEKLEEARDLAVGMTKWKLDRPERPEISWHDLLVQHHKPELRDYVQVLVQGRSPGMPERPVLYKLNVAEEVWKERLEPMIGIKGRAAEFLDDLALIKARQISSGEIKDAQG